MKYKLEKRIWTDKDFDNMGWHDNQIYQVRLTKDLEFDIDYILQWNQPDLDGLPFTFWIAPATLVFEKVEGLTFELATNFGFELEIESIERPGMENDNRWTILTQQGSFQFFCKGFQQFIRQDPFFEFGQVISNNKRGGCSLERTISQENSIRNRPDILELRQKELEHYENVKKRHLKVQELEKLIKARENNEIDTRTYIVRKNEIKEQIFSYSYFLKGTLFEDWGSSTKYSGGKFNP